MAIISSVAIGRARKSAGTLTFTRLRGQQIAKGKVAPNPDYIPTKLQADNREVFKLISKFLTTPYQFAGANLPRSKKGSKYNEVWNATSSKLRELIESGLVIDLSIEGLLSTMVINLPELPWLSSGLPYTLFSSNVVDEPTRGVNYVINWIRPTEAAGELYVDLVLLQSYDSSRVDKFTWRLIESIKESKTIEEGNATLNFLYLTEQQKMPSFPTAVAYFCSAKFVTKSRTYYLNAPISVIQWIPAS